MLEHLKKTHRKYRLRAEVLTIEEAVWFIIGISLGWFLAKGVSIMLFVAVVAIFIGFLYEQANRKSQKQNVFGEKMPRKV